MTSVAERLDGALDLLLGGRDDDRRDPRAADGRGFYAALDPDAVFVDVVRLPAGDLNEARAAISLQLDRLIPYDAENAVWDTIALDPPDPDTTRRRFLLAAAPLAALDEVRAKQLSPIECFCADVETAGAQYLVVFHDRRGRALRRGRRLRLCAAAVALLGACGAFGGAVDVWSARQDADHTAFAAAAATRLSEARSRDAAARALTQAVTQAAGGDALDTSAVSLAALAEPALPGFSVERLEVDRSAMRVVGYGEDAGAVEAALRARERVRVLQFSVAPTEDQFGRGMRIEARLEAKP